MLIHSESRLGLALQKVSNAMYAITIYVNF